MGCNKMPNKTLYFPVSHFILWVYSDQQNKTQIAYAPKKQISFLSLISAAWN